MSLFERWKQNRGWVPFDWYQAPVCFDCGCRSIEWLWNSNGYASWEEAACARCHHDMQERFFVLLKSRRTVRLTSRKEVA